MKGYNILLGLASLVVGLLVCEALLSWVQPQVSRRPAGVWQFDAELGWQHAPSSSGRLVTAHYDVEYRINADGLRDRAYPRTAAAGTARILVFGDSFVEGWGVEVEESVSKQLEEALGAAVADLEVEVINFGMAGYGTGQELLFFRRLGRLYQPDQVILVFYPNDLWNNGNRTGIGAERGFKPYFRLGPEGRLQLLGIPVVRARFWDPEAWASLPWRQRLHRYLGQHWHLYAWGAKLLSPEIPRRQSRDYYEGLYGTGDPDRWARRWELTGHLLLAFREAVERAGADLLLVYAPAIVQIDEKDWHQKREANGLTGPFDLRGPNRQLARLAARYGISLLDLSEPFKLASGEQRLYYPESHWTAAGHALAADLIGDYLAAQGLSPRSRGGDREAP